MDKRQACETIDGLREIRIKIIEHVFRDFCFPSFWLPLKRADIDASFSIVADLKRKIDNWRALQISETSLRLSKLKRPLLWETCGSFSATEAVLKDASQLHAVMSEWVDLLRERFEKMRPEARTYWAAAKPNDTFEAVEDWQQVLRQRRLDYAKSRFGRDESKAIHRNSEIWEQTGFAIAVSGSIAGNTELAVEESDGNGVIVWNAGTLPAGCFAWALDEIAGAEISEGANDSPEKNDPEYERRNRGLEPNKKSASNRGRPTKERQTENRAKFIGLISATPALLDQYQVVAGFIGVSKSTIRRWADELRNKNKSRK